MKVLIITSLFYPEIAANAKRMTHLAEGLKENGHDVSVITAFPYYSTTEYLKKYKGKWIVEDQYQEISVIRTYTYSPGKYSNLFERLWTFLSFTISSIYGSFKVKGEVDAIITISPPFFSLFSGYLISRIKKCSLVLDIQDIYPETLVALGFLKNKAAVSILEWLEVFLYRKAKGMVAISDGFKQDFISKRADPEWVEVVHNWVDVDLFQPVNSNNLRGEYGLNGKFVVMFLGTIGFAQGLESLVEAANLLKNYQNEIEFVFLGGGVEKGKLIQLIEKYGLPNFTFILPKPNSEIPGFLSLADVCLVHLKKNSLYEITIPCKTYEYLAMGKPVIMGVKGDALRVIEQGKCGIGVEPESPEELANAILKLYQNKDLAIDMGKNSRNHAISNFSKEKMISRYIALIEKCSN